MPKPLTVDHNKLWKIVKEMGISDHWPASWETYIQVMKQQWELDMRQQTGSKQEKEYVKAVYCHLAYLTSMQSTSWETLDWKKHKLKSRLPGEISITSYTQTTPPYGREHRGAKKSLDESERGEWKSGLKLNIHKMKIMASGPITSWEIDGETVSDFILGGSKITVDGDCSHEIKRLLLLGSKVMTNLLLLLLSCFSHIQLCASP